MPQTPEYYIIDLGGTSYQMWRIERNTATIVETPNPDIPTRTFQIDRTQNIEREFSNYFGGQQEIRVYPRKLGPSEFHQRMARRDGRMASIWNLPNQNELTAEIAGAVGHLQSNAARLRQISLVVELRPENLSVFGHTIRECLILASMEVESHFKAILKANGVTKQRTTTQDYVKVRIPLRLEEYEIEFPRFPTLDPIRPFAGWDPMRPTDSLPFYKVYHAVKHDRETQFQHAQLELALKAIAANFAIVIAQFGTGGIQHFANDLRDLFRLSQEPRWPPEELYYGFGEPTPVPYQF